MGTQTQKALLELEKKGGILDEKRLEKSDIFCEKRLKKRHN